MTATPVRLRFQRVKGFNLQRVSIARNGLPAVLVTRRSRWGNPFYIINEEGFPWVTDKRDPSMPVLRQAVAEAIGGLQFENQVTWDEAERGVVALFRQRCVDTLPNLKDLRGKNIACACRLCDAHSDGKPLGLVCTECRPCHGDVLLELANG